MTVPEMCQAIGGIKLDGDLLQNFHQIQMALSAQAPNFLPHEAHIYPKRKHGLLRPQILLVLEKKPVLTG